MAAKKRTRKGAPAPTLDAKVSARLATEGWESVGGGQAENIDTGAVVTGIYRGLEDSEYLRDDGSPARFVVIETEHGQTRYWAPTVLQSRMERIGVGDDVRIECLGKSVTGNGRQAWMFDVRAKRNVPAPEREAVELAPRAPRAKVKAKRRK